MTSRKPPRRPRKGTQLPLELAPRTWGGKRAGAGRKPGTHPIVTRQTRAPLEAGHPIHVTLRVLAEVPSLRRKPAYRVLRAAMRTSGHRDHFRICHYAIVGNHVHLICEADDADTLARGVQGFSSAAARRLNALWDRDGKVFADRYHGRALKTPSEVRNAVAYVLGNWRRHGLDAGKDWRTDPFSSGGLFDGWIESDDGPPAWLDDDEASPVAEPRTWLLKAGWRRGGGAISPREVPDPRK